MFHHVIRIKARYVARLHGGLSLTKNTVPRPNKSFYINVLRTRLARFLLRFLLHSLLLQLLHLKPTNGRTIMDDVLHKSHTSMSKTSRPPT